MAVGQSEASEEMALRLLSHEPRAGRERLKNKEETIMDLTQLSLGTLTTCWGVIAFHRSEQMEDRHATNQSIVNL